MKTFNTMRATKKQITEIVKYHRFEISALIAKLKEYGYSVSIRDRGSKKVIMWSTKTHWASASFIANSESDLNRVCQRLKETIYNVSFSNAR